MIDDENEKDEEISIDFSKIKNLFKRKKADSDGSKKEKVEEDLQDLLRTSSHTIDTPKHISPSLTYLIVGWAVNAFVGVTFSSFPFTTQVPFSDTQVKPSGGITSVQTCPMVCVRHTPPHQPHCPAKATAPTDVVPIITKQSTKNVVLITLPMT